MCTVCGCSGTVLISIVGGRIQRLGLYSDNGSNNGPPVTEFLRCCAFILTIVAHALLAVQTDRVAACDLFPPLDLFAGIWYSLLVELGNPR